MGSYRVYKVGEDEHVREAAAAAPAPLEGGGGGARRRGRGRAAAPRRWWVWALVAAAAVAAALLYWFYGREAVSNSKAALDIVERHGQGAQLGGARWLRSSWSPPSPSSPSYLAFGRHLAVKLIGVAVVVVVLAAPGIAVGFANGLVSDLGSTGSAATTPADTGGHRQGQREGRSPHPQQADEHPAHRLGQEHRSR